MPSGPHRGGRGGTPLGFGQLFDKGLNHVEQEALILYMLVYNADCDFSKLHLYL